MSERSGILNTSYGASMVTHRHRQIGDHRNRAVQILLRLIMMGAVIRASCVTGQETDSSRTAYAETTVPSSIDTPESRSVEKRTRIHRLQTNKRSAFDAFVYINRIPGQTQKDETARDLAGRILGRLANQEGRVLLKLPPGMTREAYDGLKVFLRTDGSQPIGNCVTCHTPPDFTDLKHHVVTTDGKPLPTPSLRNLPGNNAELAQIIHGKIRISRLSRQENADGMAPPYSTMNLTADDVAPIVAFLCTLNDVSDTRFRRLILDAKLLDTSDEIE